MYNDPSFIRNIGVRIYLNEHELAEIEAAAGSSGRERASFIRDATLVISRFIHSRRREAPRSDLLHHIQVRLSAPAANDDSHTRFCLAS